MLSDTPLDTLLMCLSVGLPKAKEIKSTDAIEINGDGLRLKIAVRVD